MANTSWNPQSSSSLLVQAFLSGPTLQGLTNGSFYAIRQDGTLSGAFTNPQTTATAATLAAAGISEGAGIYLLPPSARGITLQVQSFTQTGSVGMVIAMASLLYPFSAFGTVSNGVTGNIAIGTGTTQIWTQYPGLGVAAGTNLVSGTTNIAFRVFMPYLTATTFPSTSTGLLFQIEAY